jgi:hypothetical protein
LSGNCGLLFVGNAAENFLVFSIDVSNRFLLEGQKASDREN